MKNIAISARAFIFKGDKLLFIKHDEPQHHEIQFIYLITTDDGIEVAEDSHSDKTEETFHWLPIDKLSEYNVVPKYLKTLNFADLQNSDKVQHIITREY
ncbi:MAG: hypothetical protein FWB93_04985 [Oscillospiraceae bacterium]|nr:hypothetical protein [Oscillospiraceae bacterium]